MINDDFENLPAILLGIDDRKNSYMFIIDAATTATSKGAIPYGTLISSATVSASDGSGNNVTTELINSTSVSTNSVITKLDYPTVTGAGTYSLKFVLTLDDSSTWTKNFRRVIAEI